MTLFFREKRGIIWNSRWGVVSLWEFLEKQHFLPLFGLGFRGLARCEMVHVFVITIITDNF